MDFRLGEKAEQVKSDIQDFLAREFSEQDRDYERANGDGHHWQLYKKTSC